MLFSGVSPASRLLKNALEDPTLIGQFSKHVTNVPSKMSAGVISSISSIV